MTFFCLIILLASIRVIELLLYGFKLDFGLKINYNKSWYIIWMKMTQSTTK